MGRGTADDTMGSNSRVRAKRARARTQLAAEGTFANRRNRVRLLCARRVVRVVRPFEMKEAAK